MKKIAPHILYLWEKHCAPRLIQIFDGNGDLDKKPEIPQSKFAKLHQRYLDSKKRKS